MPKKKLERLKDSNNELKDPMAVYRGVGITFGRIEDQGDILLKMSIDKSPSERLGMMRRLNEYAYKTVAQQKLVFKNAHLIFSAYEYIPR